MQMYYVFILQITIIFNETHYKLKIMFSSLSRVFFVKQCKQSVNLSKKFVKMIKKRSNFPLMICFYAALNYVKFKAPGSKELLMII